MNSSLLNHHGNVADGTSASALSNRGYLALASGFHLAISAIVFVLGRAQFVPNVFDSNGAARFASDSAIHLSDAVSLVNQLKQGGLAALAVAPFPAHTKLYALCFAALGPLVGFNILAAEPLNLLCYLAIVVLVFKLGKLISGPRAGRLAAIIVAVWPTFLLHTTQVLKDPLFTALLLGLVFLGTYWLTKSLTWRRGMASGWLAGMLTLLLWLVRPNLWPLMLIVVFVMLVFQCLRFNQLKQIASGNLIAVSVLLVMVICVALLGPLIIAPYNNPIPHPNLTITRIGGKQLLFAVDDPAQPLPVKPPSPSSGPLTNLRERVAWDRYLFVSYPGTSSNIDADVRLESWASVIRYLPRAAEIGLLAPFPTMWFAAGAQVGRSGRMLSGFEMLIMYGVFALVVWGLWQRRDQLPVWFPAAIAAHSLFILGLATPNIGALYRLRYPFWILLIVIGVDSGLRLRATKTLRQKRREAQRH